VTIGSVLNEALEYYRKAWRHYTGVSAALFLVIGVLAAVAQEGRGSNSVVAEIGLNVVFTVAMIVGSSWLHAAVVISSEEQRHGRSFPEPAVLWEAVRPTMFRVLSAATIAALVLYFLSALLSVIALPLIVFLMTRWPLITPTVVLEDMPLKSVFRRCHTMAKGKFFDLMLLALLSVIILSVLTLAGLAAFAFLPAFGQMWLATAAVGVLGVPPVLLMWTTVYFQLNRLQPPLPA
jgi:hypothetical protein